MISPPIPEHEAERLEAVERYGLATDGREPPFDHLTQLAAHLFGVPIGLVSIVTADRQSFRGGCGLDIAGTPREVAFCAYAITRDDVFVVEDAEADPRFCGNPLVTGAPHVRFYAGAPLIVKGGHAVGTLCLIDNKARSFSQEERRRLADLARTVSDIIELRVASFVAAERQAALEEKTELLNLTVENVRQGVALFDSDLRLNLCNDAFVELFDYPPGFVKPGDYAFELMKYVAERGDLGDGDPDAIVQGFVQSILSTDSRKLEIVRVNGRHLDICRNTIRGGRFIMTVSDVTEERQLAQMKDDFVATVSHELRTPLTAIGGSIGLLAGGAGGELPPKAKHLADLAKKNSERLVTLVNDLLDIEKLESGRAEFQFETVELHALLRAVCEQNTPYADHFHVTLTLDAEDGLCVQADPGRLTQAMTNLISNAVKFSPAGGEVRICLERKDDQARISVADQGPGVPDSFRPRLFKRFAQADSSSQRGQPGTGLGLAITKNLIEQQGGTVHLDTGPTRGATFHVDLPLI
ncbi:GAF domain-containing sensor histidine kinase [Allosphingosinicella vermicomposti]|uniref:GAF domain-containing sensor histidine kinase n=1 Tax=Allosphingosinicella vermicomposti TaxID=614671 RepID=UPI000D10CB41|nr:ATP-binding protein [Allosphingosinicella vermicomposti]